MIHFREARGISKRTRIGHSRRGGKRGPRRVPFFIQEIASSTKKSEGSPSYNFDAANEVLKAREICTSLQTALSDSKKNQGLLTALCLAENQGEDASLNHLESEEEEKRTVNGINLPYMGQMTLNNSKPRRGRKPKKADICHLISKNYGLRPVMPKASRAKKIPPLRRILPSDREFLLNPTPTHSYSEKEEEPLNLCVRDVIQESQTTAMKTGEREGLWWSPSAPLLLQALQTPPLTFPDIAGQGQSQGQESVVQPDPSAFPLQSRDDWDRLRENRKLRHSSTKRGAGKRNPISVPPQPQSQAQSQAAEVSICKFKFRGGQKPCLERKKMLSVDSGGNLHFFTKALDAQVNPTGDVCDDQRSIVENNQSNNRHHDHSHPHRRPVPSNSNLASKRKSRKSLVREKLEKTFKDRGFLIQTQQFEAPQGATFCKFRQLKKFTRYLFRSWKDYLPAGGAPTN